MLTWLRLYAYFRRGGMTRKRAALRAFRSSDDMRRTTPREAASSMFDTTGG